MLSFPLTPRGICKFKTGAAVVPDKVATAFSVAATVDTVPIESYGVAPVAPVGIPKVICL